jgi:RimJ/RimL family protein N-acetyltransferase
MNFAESNCATKDGRAFVIREAVADDAAAVKEYIERVSGQSDFLSFGAGEFEMGEAEEREFLGKCQAAPNELYILGQLDETIVSTLNFNAGHRPRTRHTGEFGVTVEESFWGLGIGSLMIDAMIRWARQTGLVKKINLRVRTDNPRAIALYQRKGFVHEGTIRREIILDGQFFDNHWMGMEL